MPTKRDAFIIGMLERRRHSRTMWKKRHRKRTKAVFHAITKRSRNFFNVVKFTQSSVLLKGLWKTWPAKGSMDNVRSSCWDRRTHHESSTVFWREDEGPKTASPHIKRFFGNDRKNHSFRKTVELGLKTRMNCSVFTVSELLNSVDKC